MKIASWGLEKRDLPRLFTAIAGMFVFSIGINIFVVPAELYNGGVLGISQILRTLLIRYAHLSFGSVDVAGLINLLFNIPLFFLAYRSISRGFFVRTLICVISQTMFLTVIPIPAVPLVEDTLTASLIGGIVTGAGIGIALKNGGSSGGMDILGVYFTKRRQDFSVGRLSLTVNLFIYLACALLFDITLVIYCIIYTAVSTLIMDRTHSQNISTEVFIFTKENPEQIMTYILKELIRGATYWEAKGGYTEETTNIIFTVISKHELTALKRRLRVLDPQAFVVSKEHVGIEGKFVKHL
ncbi:MAG: YitT family protein [Lachnospiraceae bacterium]|jgi:uncharacterized membrane-anchored protein YitT (DUF2179 family)|nr:YitT family protein [Lachnospiraceae bacterium]MCI9683094.1 YitT family protein [Lachnospiraceae bacterium]